MLTDKGLPCFGRWNFGLNQLTVRGFDKDLQRSVQECAWRYGVSLNRAAVTLMRRGAGLEEPTDAGHKVGDALDPFV